MVFDVKFECVNDFDEVFDSDDIFEMLDIEPFTFEAKLEDVLGDEDFSFQDAIEISLRVLNDKYKAKYSSNLNFYSIFLCDFDGKQWKEYDDVSCIE